MFSFRKVMAQHRGRVFEKWIFDAHSPLLSSAAVGDLDGDGNPEVVFGTREGIIYCLDHEAQERWQYQTGESLEEGEEYFYDLERLHAISNQPAIGDLNNDGKKEIVFGADDGVVYALSSDGALLWKHEVGGRVRGTPRIVDLNNDGAPEVIVTSSAKKLVVLSNKGSVIAEYEMGAGSEATPGVLRGQAGRQSMIVFGLDDGSVHAINTKEERLWRFETGERVTAEPVFVESSQGTLVIIGSWDGTLYALTIGGELVWKFKTEGAIYNQAVTGDINNDGKLEVVFGSCDNNVYALTLEGEKLWSYQTDFWVMAHPLLLDLDGDGRTEVVAGSFDQNVYVFEGAGSYELDYVPGISGIMHQAGHYADLLSSEPGERQGKRLWQYRTKGMVVGCAMLGDALVVNVKSGFVDALAHHK